MIQYIIPKMVVCNKKRMLFLVSKDMNIKFCILVSKTLDNIDKLNKIGTKIYKLLSFIMRYSKLIIEWE